MKNTKTILACVTIFIATATSIHGQKSVSATSATSFDIDYSSTVLSTLELLTPAILSGDTRGFKQVNLESIGISGIVSNQYGIKEVTLNNSLIDLSSSGYFSTTTNLKVGENILTFNIIDNMGETTVKHYTINREADASNEIESGKYFALIIGIEDYSDPAIADLDNPVKDATALYTLLTEQYTFDPENTVLLKNPTRDDIYDNLDQLSANITKNDNLLIFYAGHGYWDKTAKIGYWLPSDSDEGQKRDWMRNSAVTEYVREIQSHHTLLITDACFGGSIFKTRKAFKEASVGINKLYEKTSRKAMTSGTLSEVPDESVFMKYLLKNLALNQEKHIASERLFYDVKPAVLNNSPNTPQFGVMNGTGDEGGDFIFIKR